MNKTEKFYKEILKRKVVNVKDLKNISNKFFETDDEYYYRKYLHKLLNEKKIGKIRKGLYYGIPLDKIDEEFEVDRYLAASKIENGDALGYHTALELHGSAYSAFTNVFVLVTKDDRFRRFNFKGVGYIPIVNQRDIGHITSIEYKNNRLNFTDTERTFVDCISRTDLCGGWEECLKSLEILTGVSLSKIKEVLDAYDNKTLELTSGYILELLSNTSPYYDHIKKEKLNTLKPNKDWKPVYIDRNVKSSLNKEWGLYIPDHLDGLLRGV